MCLWLVLVFEMVHLASSELTANVPSFADTCFVHYTVTIVKTHVGGGGGGGVFGKRGWHISGRNERMTT